MTKLMIKTGDEVVVIAGADRGKRGKVIQTFPGQTRVVVDGVRASTRHVKTRKQGEKGQAVSFFMPLHASNVQLVGGDGKRMRHTKRTRT